MENNKGIAYKCLLLFTDRKNYIDHNTNNVSSESVTWCRNPLLECRSWYSFTIPDFDSYHTDFLNSIVYLPVQPWYFGLFTTDWTISIKSFGGVFRPAR